MTTRSPLRKAAAGIITALIAVTVLAADQFTKHLAIDALDGEGPVQILGDFLIFRLVRNPGAAFSLGEGVTWIFTIALAAVAVGIVVLLFRGVKSRLWAVVLGGLLGGVSGNLTDRLLREPGFPVGHVVDFISTPWMMPAIYNVADIFIVSSMIAVALLVLIGLHLDGTREQAKTKSDADADAEADVVTVTASEVAVDGGTSGAVLVDDGATANESDADTSGAVASEGGSGAVASDDASDPSDRGTRNGS